MGKKSIKIITGFLRFMVYFGRKIHQLLLSSSSFFNWLCIHLFFPGDFRQIHYRIRGIVFVIIIINKIRVRNQQIKKAKNLNVSAMYDMELLQLSSMVKKSNNLQLKTHDV